SVIRTGGIRFRAEQPPRFNRPQFDSAESEEAAVSDAGEPKPCSMPRTISPIDEDELQIHKLYRERIVQEDNLINHRMTWMIISQAFLLATFGAFAQKIFGPSPENLYTETRIVCVIGMIFALGSKLSIRAAQDEIDGLRVKYLDMYPPEEKDKGLPFIVE